jgi:hypothetical protein
MSDLYFKALSLNAQDFGKSNRKNKRFYVLLPNNKYIHFGSNTNNTYYDHQDIKKRDAWRARHSKIINSKGVPYYLIKSSPEYWAYNLLW